MGDAVPFPQRLDGFAFAGSRAFDRADALRADAAALRGLWPDARLLVLAGCGHVPQMEQPEATARAMLALWRDDAASSEGPGPRGGQDRAGRAATVDSDPCGSLVR